MLFESNINHESQLFLNILKQLTLIFDTFDTAQMHI